ncbi:MAG: non-homologous end-joining DNA ligase [Marinobacter sp.]|uniref:non-homologous end-joining DNA ligase n=1 Tax=Marinobacter sp. TaxID=50741 RepID=UPI00396EEFEE
MQISHPDKLIFPDSGIKKRDLIDYFRKIAPIMLPHLRGRPLTLRSFPEGIGEEGFFLKHAPEHFPSHIERLEVPMRSRVGKTMLMVTADKANDLTCFANQNVVELHVALSLGEALDRPDQMIFDLDPSDNDFEKVRELALGLKSLLGQRDLPSFVKTTGSRGVHVHVPLRPEETFERVKPVVQRLAEELLTRCPDIATMEHRKEKRGNRVFIDYLRNDYGMTAVAPYSLRAIEGAPVATPISWSELKDRKTGPQSWGLANIFRRLGAKKDPWQNFKRHRVSLPHA